VNDGQRESIALQNLVERQANRGFVMAPIFMKPLPKGGVLLIRVEKPIPWSWTQHRL
jgi:hypothetical protein